MNTCGACNVCCKRMGVVEIGKPVGVWCPECAIGHGCNIYDRRPPSCAEFQCVWLAEGLPANLRPDLSHVLMISDEDNSIVAKVDIRHPDAHKSVDMRTFLKGAVNDGRLVFIVLGDADNIKELHYSTEALLGTGHSDRLAIVRKLDAEYRCV